MDVRLKLALLALVLLALIVGLLAFGWWKKRGAKKTHHVSAINDTVVVETTIGSPPASQDKKGQVKIDTII